MFKVNRRINCRKCGDQIWKNGLCKDCSLLAVKEWYRLNGSTKRWRLLRRRYGITRTEYYALLKKQEGKCAICSRRPSGNVKEKYLHLDHSHSTLQNRGLLCIRCNLMIGQIENAVLFAAAMKYLKSFTNKKEKQNATNN